MLQIIFVDPILNLIIWFATRVPSQDLTLMIFLLALALRVLLLPVGYYQAGTMRRIRYLQPKIDEIKARYHKPLVQNEEINKLYKENHTNPLKLPLAGLIQLPILIAVFVALSQFLDIRSSIIHTYDSVKAMPGFIGFLDHYGNFKLFGLISAETPNVFLAIVAGLSQVLASWTTQEGLGKISKIVYLVILPIVITLISLYFSAALAWFWIVSNVLLAGQNWMLKLQVRS